MPQVGYLMPTVVDGKKSDTCPVPNMVVRPWHGHPLRVIRCHLYLELIRIDMSTKQLRLTTMEP